MKLVYIFQSMAKTAGTERILTEKMNYFAERPNYQVYLITCEQGGHSTPFPLSSKIKHIDLDVRFFTLYRYGKIKRYFLQRSMERTYKERLEKCINEIQPDIVCCTTYAPFEINAVIQLKDKSAKIIEAHTTKTSNEKQKNYEHNKILHYFAKLQDNQVYKTIGKYSALVTLTHGDAKEWENVKKAVVIPNIVSYRPTITEAKQTNRRVISVGRLSTQKGYDILVDVWKTVHQKHPEWILDIYGTGEQKDMLLQKIKEYNLENVLLIHDPTPDIYNKYMESDIYVMSSRWEGFGLVLVEAMSCGVPCVSFDCPYGPSDIICNGEDGIVVEPQNKQQLADSICSLIENEAIRKLMGEKAWVSSLNFLPENIMPQWEELFHSLIESKKKNNVVQ